MSARIRTSGVLVLLVGVWGALVPFVGPLFGYRMGHVPAWTMTESHVTLHLVPGVVAALGGLLMMAGPHPRARAGGVLSVLGGAWFILGPTFHPAWGSSGRMMMGGSVWRDIATSLGYHYGTGLVICAFAAYALGALAVTRASATASAAPIAQRDVTLPRTGERERSNVS